MKVTSSVDIKLTDDAMSGDIVLHLVDVPSKYTQRVIAEVRALIAKLNGLDSEPAPKTQQSPTEKVVSSDEGAPPPTIFGSIPVDERQDHDTRADPATTVRESRHQEIDRIETPPEGTTTPTAHADVTSNEKHREIKVERGTHVMLVPCTSTTKHRFDEGTVKRVNMVSGDVLVEFKDGSVEWLGAKSIIGVLPKVSEPPAQPQPQKNSQSPL